MVYGIGFYTDVGLLCLGSRHSNLLPVCRLAVFTYALLSAFRFALAFWCWSFSWTSLCRNRTVLLAALSSRVLHFLLLNRSYAGEYPVVQCGVALQE